ncbi:hypothetical protein EUX98_g8667 [Antrodiella citrinella]|uniref:Retrotransposon Copia-like N-terminal domain-containing protein n=1 Tax=Antrodiella citrinella TaxID=2447956 RepID=A0A4S4M4T2_9APHY|nr:hypothetical protein EUX98_g8667 [Antrodiella citrinella]
MSGDSEGSGNAYRIEPLKAENYYTWRIQVMDILTDKSLEGYVDGSKPIPPLPANATTSPAIEAWTKNDRKALTNIRLRVSGEMIPYVSGATTSKAAWESLADVFTTKGPMGIVLARREILDFRFNDDTDIEEQVRKLRTCTEKLAMLGAPLPDDQLALTVLTALPQTWNPFVSAVDQSKLDSANIIGRIILEGHRRKDQTNGTTTLLTTSPSNNQRRTNSSTSNNPRSRFQHGVWCYCERERSRTESIRRGSDKDFSQ